MLDATRSPNIPSLVSPKVTGPWVALIVTSKSMTPDVAAGGLVEPDACAHPRRPSCRRGRAIRRSSRSTADRAAVVDDGPRRLLDRAELGVGLVDRVGRPEVEAVDVAMSEPERPLMRMVERLARDLLHRIGPRERAPVGPITGK